MDTSVNYSNTISKSLHINRWRDDADYLERLYGHLTPHLPPNRDARILDLGCGGGLFLRYCLNNGYHELIAVDSDPQLCESVADWLGTKPVCSTISDYLRQCPEEMFDAIAMNNVIEHIPKQELIPLLKAIRRALKKGGVFLATTGNIENPMNLGLFLRDFTHEIGFTKNSLRQVSLLAGFSAEDTFVGEKELQFKTRKAAKRYRIRSTIANYIVRTIMRMMMMRIDSLAKFIYCVSRK